MIYGADGKIDWKAMEELNNDHANNPRAGDYWSEMFAPILVVIGRTEAGNVIICKETKSTGIHRQRIWDLEKIETMSVEDFSKYLHYDSDRMKHKCWCDCDPESMMGVRDEAIKVTFGNAA